MSPQSVLSAARRLDGSRRFLVLGVVAAAIAIIGVVGKWAATPSYVTLYHDLDLSESGQMMDQLAKAGVPRRLANGGAELQVPPSELARARVLLAKNGLPSNGRPGLELFDKPSWGMTDFTQRVTYQRALEGELARTIAAIRGIERAQVHLVLTSSSALRRLERAASASVVLTLKGGQPLAPDAVQGITYIVSNSVEQLSAENVAVMDDAGHVLSVPAGTDGSAGLTTRQLETQRAMERHVSDKIEELLATVVGPGCSRAEVSAELSFDQVDRTVESFDPDGQVLENEQRSEGGATGGGDASQTVVNNSYQNSRRLEKSSEAAGRIKRLTIAVLVDQKALKGGVGGRPKLEADALEAMVANAAGVDSARGDRVIVQAVPFDAALAAKDVGTGSEKPKADPMVVVERFSHPFVGLVAIAALVVVALMAFKSLGGGAAAGPELATATAAAAPEPAPVPQLPPLAPVKKDASGMEVEFQRKLVGGSQDRLDAAAQVVKGWLAES